MLGFVVILAGLTVLIVHVGRKLAAKAKENPEGFVRGAMLARAVVGLLARR